MPKKGRRSGRDDALGAGPGALGGDEDYEWIRYLGEGSSSRSSAGSSPAVSAPTSTALQAPARTVTARPARPPAARPAVARPPAARPPAARPPTAQRSRFGPEQGLDSDTDPGAGPIRHGGAGSGRGLAGRPAAGPPQPYDPLPYEPESYQPESYQLESHQPEPYQAAAREPQGHDSGPGTRAGRRGRSQPGVGPAPSRSPSGTGTGRAVKVRQGRTTDLLFNPAAEDYGQPLYPPGEDGQRPGASGTAASPSRAPDRQPYDGFPSRQRRLDPAEFARPLYPALDSGPATDARPRRSPPGADPLAGTDAHGRTAPGGRRPARSSRGGRPAPALPGPESPDRDDRADRAGPQRRVGGLIPPDPLTGSGIGAHWAAAPAAAPARVAPEAAVTSAPARRAGTGPADRPAFDVADPVAGDLPGTALPGTAPRGTPARNPGKGAKKGAASKPKPVKSRPRARRRKAMALLGGLVLVAALAAVGYFRLMPRTSHTVSAPAALGSFVKQQANATAKNLRHRIMVAAPGDVMNVVAAVYEQKKGPDIGKGPQIVVFIGGNLTGNASAGDLISAYMTRLHGAVTTSPGGLGGQAACAPGSNGGPSECAWADGDTFGVVVSATLGAQGLAGEMRQMRPLIEHIAR